MELHCRATYNNGRYVQTSWRHRSSHHTFTMIEGVIHTFWMFMFCCWSCPELITDFGTFVHFHSWSTWYTELLKVFRSHLSLLLVIHPWFFSAFFYLEWLRSPIKSLKLFIDHSMPPLHLLLPCYNKPLVIQHFSKGHLFRWVPDLLMCNTELISFSVKWTASFVSFFPIESSFSHPLKVMGR